MTSSIADDGLAADWFCDLMKDLAAAYPNFRLGERQPLVYARALQDLTPAQVRNAMGRAIVESRFFPSVAELRQYAEPSTDDRAQCAWLALREAVGAVGAWRSIVIDDPWAAEAFRRAAVSWPSFCAMDDGPALFVLRQGFLASYRDARRTIRSDAPAVRFAGQCETSGQLLDTKDGVARLMGNGSILREPTALPPASERPQLSAGEVP